MEVKKSFCLNLALINESITNKKLEVLKKIWYI